MQKSRAKVLVVDDDPNLLDLLVDTLTAIGYRTIPAHGGIRALELLSEDKFDIMVTDIKMPDLDGIQLLKRVRRHYPDMPVVFITGVASREIMASAAPDGFLAKPFRIQHIEEMIESTLGSKGYRRTSAMRKVLVVEPDEATRSTLTEALDYCDYIPFSVSGTVEALQELENGSFDAVIADLYEPSLDGLRLGDQIKERYPATRVILMGAIVPEAIAERGGFDGFVQKPLQIGMILRLLETGRETN